MLEVIGIISAICMTISSIPQAWSVYKKGSAEELSMATQILWLVGELCYIVYIWPMQNWILLANCIPPLICIFTTIYYKLFPRGPKNDTATRGNTGTGDGAKHERTS
jgi:uncharacterized protein with PQ loop repeat